MKRQEIQAVKTKKFFILDNHHWARLARIVVAARYRPDIATSHSSPNP